MGNLFRSLKRIDRRYGKGGQLREANGTRYKYDVEGNLVRKRLPDGRVWRYTWDGMGQLLEVRRPDNYTVTFAYDALGRRISKRFRGKVTKWVWHGNKPLHEWHELEVGPGAGSAEDLRTWLFEDGSFALTAKLTAKGTYSVVSDHLGTPLTMHDEQGKAIWEMSLDAYGGVRQGKGQAQDCPFRYQGQYEDIETGLYYNRFRYYDPETGDYISQDPIGIKGGHRLYKYVGNTQHELDILGLTVCKQGKATIHHSPGHDARDPFGHYSIETTQISENGAITKVHSHQVITSSDHSTTTVDLVQGPREGVTIPIAN